MAPPIARNSTSMTNSQNERKEHDRGHNEKDGNYLALKNCLVYIVMKMKYRIEGRFSLTTTTNIIWLEFFCDDELIHVQVQQE